jgi:hypothetical protein
LVDAVPEPRTSATLDRAAGLVDALLARALRQERVLEVLDLRAARSARQMAQQLRAAAAWWASDADPLSRSEAASELLQLMDAAEIVLLVSEAPAPSTGRPPPPTSSVISADDLVTEERVRPEGIEDASPESDESTWQAMLGVPRRRR